jgi:hypothetical protein
MDIMAIALALVAAFVAKPSDLGSRLDSAHWRRVHGILIAAIHAEQGIELGLVIGINAAGAGANGLARQVEILAQMAGVLGDDLG